MIEKNPERKNNVEIKINFKGKGGHSSTPFRLKNPIIASLDFIHLLENNIWWGFSQFENVVVEPVDYDAGTKSNIIPETAFLALHGEYSENEQLEKIKKFVNKSVEAVKSNYDVDSTVEFSK